MAEIIKNHQILFHLQKKRKNSEKVKTIILYELNRFNFDDLLDKIKAFVEKDERHKKYEVFKINGYTFYITDTRFIDLPELEDQTLRSEILLEMKKFFTELNILNNWKFIIGVSGNSVSYNW